MFLVILVSVVAMCGCGGTGVAFTPTPTPASYYPIVTVSDLHFNPFYDPSLYSQLVTADPATQWADIFKGSGKKAPSTAGTDTNYPLLMLTLTSMKQNMGSSPIVLFTGDLLGHNIPTTYCALLPSPPANCMTAESAQIQQFINNTFTFVATQIRQNVGDVPVIYVPGNIDTYSGGYGPSPLFLQSNAQTVYAQFLNGAGDEAAFTSNFSAGGYYSVEPLGSKLRVIGLNSNSFVTGSPTFNDGQVSWLSSQLQSAQQAGQKVWILMHVPPGANSQTIAGVAETPGDVDANDVSMNWDTTTVQPAFMKALAEYPGLVTLMLAGHTHMDEFRMLPAGDVLEQLPGISPCFGNNPAYKVLTVTQDTFTPTDYQSLYYNLAALPPPGEFATLYRFSTTYTAQSTLGNSLGQLYPQFAANAYKRDTYSLLYGSGTTSVNPVTFAPWNPINDVNWPIFACTIGEMDESDYVNCVSKYEPSSANSVSFSPPDQR